MKYYKIKTSRPNQRCWLGEGHGNLYFTSELQAMILSEVAISSHDIHRFIIDNGFTYEFIPIDTPKKHRIRVYDDEYVIYKDDDYELIDEQ